MTNVPVEIVEEDVSDKVTQVLPASPTLCFELKYFGEGGERRAEEETDRWFALIKKDLPKDLFIPLKEALSTNREAGGRTWYRKRVHIKATAETVEWSLAKDAIRKTITPYFYMVDFAKQIRPAEMGQ